MPEYHIPFYTTNPNSTYPEEVSIKYPKAGSPNPIVSLHVHSLLDKTSVMVTQNATAETKLQAVDAHKDFDDEDRIITDVAWVTTTHTHLLFKQMNRIQDHEITNLVTIGATLNASTVQVARRYEPTDGGWIDTAQAMKYVPQGDNDKVHYIDIADDGHGYMHLAIFSANDRKQAPVWLTKGEYEVDWSSVVLDTERQLVYVHEWIFGLRHSTYNLGTTFRPSGHLSNAICILFHSSRPTPPQPRSAVPAPRARRSTVTMPPHSHPRPAITCSTTRGQMYPRRQSERWTTPHSRLSLKTTRASRNSSTAMICHGRTWSLCKVAASVSKQSSIRKSFL